MVCMSSGELLRPGNRFLLSCITFFELNQSLHRQYGLLHLPYNPACKLHLPQSDRLLRFFSEYWAHRWDKGKLRFHGKALVPCEGFLRISFLPVIYFPYPDLLSWFDFQKTPATVLEKLSWSNLYCININKKGGKIYSVLRQKRRWNLHRDLIFRKSMTLSYLYCLPVSMDRTAFLFLLYRFSFQMQVFYPIIKKNLFLSGNFIFSSDSASLHLVYNCYIIQYVKD